MSFWGPPIILKLPYEQEDGKETRDTVSNIVKLCWDAVNEWTKALNEGSSTLKTVVSILTNSKAEDELTSNFQTETQKLNSSFVTMEKVVKILKGANKELRKVIDLEEKKCSGRSNKSFFVTIPLSQFGEAINLILEGYEKETAVKQIALNPLMQTRDIDTLNHCITMWTTHAYLPHPHLFHIHMLMIETKQLS